VEKRTPHCKLSVVKIITSKGNVRTTQQARQSAVALGMTFSDMLEVVMSLQTKDFHKSMTTHSDYTIWQDVYRTPSKVGMVYLKLTVIDDVLIVSFKEL
jgi:motility quorum-sensing regulator/GCU-specific mRNA interferase toxin